MFDKQTPLIGIDIGSGLIKIAQFEERKGHLALVNFGVVETPENSVEQGKIVAIDNISDAIKSLLQLHSFIGKRVVASVSGQLVTVRQLSIEELRNQDFSEIVKWEMEKFLPFAVEEAVVDYQVLSRSKTDIGYKNNVLAVAATIDVVNSVVEVIKKSGLNIVAIEVEPFAEMRLLNYIKLKRPDLLNKAVVIINIGASYTSINILEEDMIRFTRIVPFGGKKCTSFISSKLGINIEKAEEMKKELANLDPDILLPEESDQEKATTSILPLLEELVLEIRRSLNYYATRFESKLPFYLMISGGSANLKGFEKYLYSSLGMPAEINRLLVDLVKYDPTMFSESYLISMAPLFSVCSGLALREVEEKMEKRVRKGKKPLIKEREENIFTYKAGVGSEE